MVPFVYDTFGLESLRDGEGLSSPFCTEWINYPPTLDFYDDGMTSGWVPTEIYHNLLGGRFVRLDVSVWTGDCDPPPSPSTPFFIWVCVLIYQSLGLPPANPFARGPLDPFSELFSENLHTWFALLETQRKMTHELP